MVQVSRTPLVLEGEGCILTWLGRLWSEPLKELLKSTEGRDHRLGMQLGTILDPYICPHRLRRRVYTSTQSFGLHWHNFSLIDLNSRYGDSDADNSLELGEFWLQRSRSLSRKLNLFFGALAPIEESLFRRCNLLCSHS